MIYFSILFTLTIAMELLSKFYEKRYHSAIKDKLSNLGKQFISMQIPIDLKVIICVLHGSTYIDIKCKFLY